MKKVIFSALAALSALALSLPVAAQEIVDVEEERELDLDMDISVHAGYQGSFLKDFTAYPGATRSLHSGVRIGVDADFEVYEYKGFEFGIRPGVFFSQKGERYKDNADKALSYDLNYLDIPVTLRVSREVKDDLDLVANVGPYLGIGLYGKNIAGSTSTEKHDSFGNAGELRRIDSGLIGSIGLKYDDLLLTVGGQYGFVDQLKDTKRLTGSPKNANFFIMVGYEF